MVDVNIRNAIHAILGSGELANPGLVLRGSVLLSLWVGQERRRYSDLDLLATYPPNQERTTREITSLLTAANLVSVEQSRIHVSDKAQALGSSRVSKPEPAVPLTTNQRNLVCNELRVDAIFEETEFPGLRYHVPVGQDSEQTELQIDVAFNDPLPFGVQLTDLELAGKQTKIPSPAPEVMYAWKLHGLIEFEGLRWRKKDLADLWLLQKHVPLDKHRLRHAVEITFESRDTPNWRLRRLLDGNIGRSKSSQRQWRKLRERYNESVYPKVLHDVVNAVRQFIKPILGDLCSAPPFSRLPPPTLEEVQIASVGKPVRGYRWAEAGQTHVFEGSKDQLRCPPLHAATNEDFRMCVVERELRGITFDAAGKLLARPYAMFEPWKDFTEKEFCQSEILEKLDGSLVFPTPIGDDWVLRTKRGRSTIADDAMRFAVASPCGYSEFISRMFRQQRTPLFEWCSRKHTIVLDHPVDRLVLTGIRCNQTGKLAKHAELAIVEKNYSIPVVRIMQRPPYLAYSVDAIRNWTECEGVIFRLSDGRQFKLKSERYRWLHRSVEGPNRDRARWFLWLSGAKEQLLKTSAARSIDLTSYLNKIQSCFEQVCESVRNDCKNLPADRREFAAAIRERESWYRVLCFAHRNGKDLLTELKAAAKKSCHRNADFQSLIARVGGPLLND